MCYRILRDEEEAKDVAQEVFVRIYLKRKSFKGRSALYTWIHRIALNMCFSHLKKHKARFVPLDEVEGTLEARSVRGGASYAELEGLLAKALDSLPTKQRAVFTMRFYEKMSFKEISEAYEIPWNYRHREIGRIFREVEDPMYLGEIGPEEAAETIVTRIDEILDQPVL